MSKTVFSALIDSLTVEQAKIWQEQDEPFMHIVDTFDEVLKPDGSVVEARVEAIEARFLSLLEDAS